MLQGEEINMSISAPFKEDKNKGLLDGIIRSPLVSFDEAVLVKK